MLADAGRNSCSNGKEEEEMEAQKEENLGDGEQYYALLGINNSSQGMADRAGKSSSRRSAWKRFPTVLEMCFIVGVLLGLLTPDNWTSSSSSSSSDTAKSGQDLASSDFIEGIKVENVASSGEVANALEETSGIGTKSRELVGVDAVANLSSIMLDPGSFSVCCFFLAAFACLEDS
ncbi:unnamed protein product [Sphagnum tenellum]